ncbi:hypothetical protein A3C98_01700 [Candidatus Roizmanbacteria bacterium RIFCSPHIGHO2_02_FULL_37_15]|uniref:Uncharacterized protein n=1 Tax=Candidatus Roizmanbacteria bacterium RIFCSPLOWO2_01_FULL_37_16 TaxID=1802058 RepID=A0A1F7ILS9_9BACT|nr:MAG: hypothetical protein A3C98_01700 [Candidatus Roizmanbacteria bacterium RIFCSPHIGHO2_02_FULL_37_15]OGK33782.1 MAG: hypothetical protein A3F57_00880 [Candidatus Roizmanbacteria bacterium RIFCSPHIGHO2_12_FULL_36_11]OGK44303.1 MAG: hypothetical protein A3B40_01550 [Candidatus Roizmanbacteria bacterium RIFCSPLOWO2_01_FULL_37_16]OGK57831.1 MAG: hypothetical protein A3I50_03790 [Candidatus Roizmanbacteria bacterium RIFCSPLOWO2_02_FULL_37_9]
MISILSETPKQADILSSLPVDVSVILAGLKMRRFPLELLMASKFSPYHPQSQEFRNFNDFCTTGIEDMRLLIGENEDVLKEVGLLSAAIIGSAASRLAGVFPYGVLKDRQPNQYYLRRAANGNCDIDTNFHIVEGEMDRCVSLMRELALSYRQRGRFKSEPGTLSFYFISYQQLIDTLRTRVRVYAFVSALIWQNTRIPLLNDDIYGHVQQTALGRYSQDSGVQEFFWQNLLDRYLFAQSKLAVKSGQVEEVILTPQNAPTIFDHEAKAVKAKCDNGYFKI